MAKPTPLAACFDRPRSRVLCRFVAGAYRPFNLRPRLDYQKLGLDRMPSRIDRY